jgi:hypothetical protein
MLLRRLLEHRQIATRIDECAAHRVRAPEERAILLKRGDGDEGGFERRLGHAADVADARGWRKGSSSARIGIGSASWLSAPIGIGSAS